MLPDYFGNRSGRAWFIALLLALAGLGQTARPARAAHLDVWVHRDAADRLASGYYDVNADAVIVRSARAIGYNFQEFDEQPYYANNPGFFAAANSSPGGSGLPGGSGVGFNILSGLRYWNGVGTPQLDAVPAGESLTFNVGSQNRLIGPLTGPQAGFNIQNVRSGASEGSLHTHFNSYLNAGPGSPTPTDGLYAVQIELTTTAPGVATSRPLWIVFNNAAGEDKRGELINQLYPNQWAGPLGGSFNTQLNWTGRVPVELNQIVPVPEVPNAVDAVARLFDNLASASMITVDSPVTLGTIQFDSAARYTLAGPAAIALQSTTTARIEMSGGSHTLAAPLQLISNTTIDAGSGMLDVTGPLAWAAGRSLDVASGTLSLASSSVTLGTGAQLNIASGATVQVSGATNPLADSAHRVAIENHGALTVGGGSKVGGPIAGTGATRVLANSQFTIDSLVQGAVVVDSGGTLKISNATSAPNASKLTSLSLAGAAAPTASFDLTDNRLVIDYAGASPLASVANQIASGYQSGTWNGPGIASSVAAASHLAIGFAEAQSLAGSVAGAWFGQSVDSTSLLLRLTTYGDADLSGGTNFSDLSKLLLNYNQPGTWSRGDFNYDGVVNFSDLSVLLLNYNLTAPTSASLLGSPAPNVQSVPEPAGLQLCAVSGTLALLVMLRTRWFCTRAA